MTLIHHLHSAFNANTLHEVLLQVWVLKVPQPARFKPVDGITLELDRWMLEECLGT